MTNLASAGRDRVHRNTARWPSKKLAKSLKGLLRGFIAKAPLCRLVLSQIPRVIEIASLQIGFGRREVGNGGFAENVGDDILDRRIGDLMNEADIPVFAGRHARDHT